MSHQGCSGLKTQLDWALVGATSLFVAMTYTVELIYQARTVGLTPFQLVLAGSVNQGVSFLAQAPTGALADLYSRRWAIVVGLLLIGTGFLIEGLIPAFGAVLVAQSLWGWAHRSCPVPMRPGSQTNWALSKPGRSICAPLRLAGWQRCLVSPSAPPLECAPQPAYRREWHPLSGP
jgi:hypothetical protein